MREFPFLLSAAFLYWGYFSDNLILSVLFAIMSESWRFTDIRWDFTQKDFNNISMIPTIMSIGYIIYFANSDIGNNFFLSFFQFVPAALFPLVFFYLFSTSKYINAKRLFLLFVTNKYSLVKHSTRHFRPDILLFIALLTGGSINAGSFAFIIPAILIIPLIYKYRSRNHSLIIWSFSFISVILISLFIQFSFEKSFYFTRSLLRELYADYLATKSSSGRRNSNLGNIGTLKNDLEIDLRVKRYSSDYLHTYIYENFYNYYTPGIWHSKNEKYDQYEIEYFDYENKTADSLRIFFYPGRRNRKLKLPYGTTDVDGLDRNSIRISSTGMLKMQKHQYLADYKALIRTDSLEYYYSSPREIDLYMNPQDTTLVDGLIDSLDLKNKSSDQVFNILQYYFNRNYTYSLDYIDYRKIMKLSRFVKLKEGHCELFATLSALIYRRLDIPSRYATGYLVWEYSQLEKLFLARKRDKHAWIIVFNEDSLWKPYDLTPPDISGYHKDIGLFGSIYGYFSHLYFKFFSWKMYINDIFRNFLLLSSIPFIIFLLFRILRDVKKKDRTNNKYNNPYIKTEELKKIEKKLSEFKEYPGNETVAKWLRDISGRIYTPSELEKIKNIYYSLRYSDRNKQKDKTKELDKLLNKITKKD